MNTEKKVTKFNMGAMLLSFALIPLIVTVIITTIVNCVVSTGDIKEQTTDKLITASRGLKSYYERDLQNLEDGIDHEYSIVDSYKSENIELTLFLDDIRYITSIKDSNGNRIEGTAASSEIWNTVKSGKDYYSENVMINDAPYFVYYMPVYGADGNVAGMAFAGESCDSLNMVIMSTICRSILVAILCIIFFVIIGLVVTKIVVKPLKQVTDTIVHISEGDLTYSTDMHSGLKETQLLILAAKDLKENLSNVLHTAVSASETMLSSSNEMMFQSKAASENTDQISEAIEDLAQGSSSMAQSVQDISEQVTDLTHISDELTSYVDELSQSSGNIKMANDNATSYMTKLSESSQNSVDVVKHIEQQIQDTNLAVDNIKVAVDTIQSIANQTNLLALNASIEAARAGEAGRGFAVVAQEINSLSVQSAGAAKEIAEIVKNIVLKSEDTVQSSKDVLSVINTEQDYIAETLDKVNTLSSEVDKSLLTIGEITNTTGLLVGVRKTVGASVEDLSAVSEESAASNQEIAASISSVAKSVADIANDSASVNDVAHDLSLAIRFFKL